MNRIYLLIPFILISLNGLFAQQREIEGNIKDENNNPLPSVSVYNSKTKKSGNSDLNGNFKISV